MAEFTLEEMLRTGHVKRWQIVRTAREQTLAEHLYRVWVITQYVCRAIEYDETATEIACTWALMHDVPEVITGDIATPAKEAMRKAIPNNDPVHNIELQLSDSYRRVWAQAKGHIAYCGSPPPYDIVKLADLIEAKMFINMEGIGKHAREVAVDTARKVNQHLDRLICAHPRVKWENLKDILITSGENV